MDRRKVLQSLFWGGLTTRTLIEDGTWFSGHMQVEDENKMEKPDELIWYQYPGRFWNSQSMHIGNGFLGISFLGGVHEEIMAVTEKSLWTGGPGETPDYAFGILPGGKEYLPEIRRLILSNETENIKKADELTEKHFLGTDKGYGYFSSFGRVSFIFDHGDDYSGYSRRLDLAQSLSQIEYTAKSIKFKREYFCSYPNKVGVMKFSSDKRESISFRIRWQVFQKDHELRFENNVLQLSGTVNGNGRKFCLKMLLQLSGGKVQQEGNDVVISGADRVTVLTTAATEYMPVPPLYMGADPFSITSQQIQAAGKKTYDQLKSNHISDYKSLYDRVVLNIPGNRGAAVLPTNIRWNNYRNKKMRDPGFKRLYFNLGRYLLISSSRPGSLPANLQGGWNMIEKAPWAGNYQSNINLQLNYAGACSAGLNECMLPYIEWINNLVVPGRETAKAYYGTKGWVSHTVGNIWGYTAPASGIVWGMYPAGAAWHCHFIWKYYSYTNDKGYLEKTAYPIMKEASLFWLANLVPYKGGLISAPSVSAEHGALIIDGKILATGSTSDKELLNIPGNFQDIQMVRELFENTIAAMQVLETDGELAEKLQFTLKKLLPLKTGQYGQLQEWEADIDNPLCNHRHIAHLYAVWPAKQISPLTTPQLAAAAKKALNMRGEERFYKKEIFKDMFTASNWSLSHRLACWLRLRDAERANKIFSQIITECGFENGMTFQQTPDYFNAYPKNLPDIEYFTTQEGAWTPVWQVDASMAVLSFVSEMLLQEQEGIIYLLPALPGEWPDGNIKGLKAEGNLTLDLEWKNGKIKTCRVVSLIPQKIKVHYNGELREIISNTTG